MNKTYYGIPNPDEKKPREDHDGHKLIVSPSPGKHYGRLSCMTCGNKFVRWLNKEQYQYYKSMG
jgi:hypothetical protein